MKVKFWGVRGTVPVPGRDTVRVGGNTSCVEVRAADEELLVLDAGTGIRLLGLELVQGAAGPLSAVLLLSHLHWDHVQGFPFFYPARQEGNRLVIMGEGRIEGRLEQLVARQMSYPHFPLTLAELEAALTFQEIQSGECIVTGAHTTVLAQRLPHPGGAFGYRISCLGKTAVYATDVNHPQGCLDPRVVGLAQAADLLVHDAQYTPEEKQERLDWGHSSWLEAIQVAQEANVRRLALFHHDPLRRDDELEEIERQARAIFPGAFVAREGLEIVL